MKVVILAGGLGTRLSEETHSIPKPMVKIGNKPILWHIMKIYSTYGINEFIICLGYKGEIIKDFFLNYQTRNSDFTIDLESNNINFHKSYSEDWKVSLIDTGDKTQTGGRIKRIKEYVGDDTFFLTYGDGLCSVNISELLQFHKSHQSLATVTAIQPPGRWGVLNIKDSKVASFSEKISDAKSYINGGFFVLEPGIFDYIQDDTTIWEKEPLETLAREGQLTSYCHEGFWKAMDTLREKNELNDMYAAGNAPWKKW